MSQFKISKTQLEHEIIELVKCRPTLWKRNERDHGNAVIIGYHWDSIHDIVAPNPLVKNGKECAKIWKKMWYQYLKYVRKIQRNVTKANGKPIKFRHSESMKFFDRLEENDVQRAVSNVNERNPSGKLVGNRHLLVDEVASDSTSAVSEQIISPGPSSAVAPKRKKSKHHPITKELIDVIKGKELNDIEHFCSLIAIKLQKISELNPKLATKLQINVHDMVLQAESQARRTN